MATSKRIGDLNKMANDIGKAVYWMVVVIIAVVIVIIGANIVFSVFGLFIAVIISPMLFTKIAANSGASKEEAPKPEVKNETNNFFFIK